MKKIAAIGFALLMVFAVFVPFVSANDGAKETKGYLYVDLACRSPQIGGEFTIAPVVVSAPFTDAARVDVGFVNEYVKYVGPVEVKQFLPNGQFDMTVEPGTYVLAMKDGNGGQPEFALVTLNAGEKETVVFLGHGITAADMPKDHQPVVVIKTATYGATHQVVDEPEHYDTVTTAEAYTEHFGDYNADHVFVGAGNGDYTRSGSGVNDPFVFTFVEPTQHEAVYTPYDGGGAHVHAKPAEGSAHDFTYEGVTYQITGTSTDQKFKKVSDAYETKNGDYKKHGDHYDFVGANHGDYTRSGSGVNDPFVFTFVEPTQHEAVTEQVFVPATYKTEGAFVNVKAKVQAVVDNGVTSFKFDNAQNPGGIFSTDNTLLEQINDPAPGQVKTVKIKYTVDGVAKTVNAQEYETINLL